MRHLRFSGGAWRGGMPGDRSRRAGNVHRAAMSDI